MNIFKKKLLKNIIYSLLFIVFINKPLNANNSNFLDNYFTAKKKGVYNVALDNIYNKAVTEKKLNSFIADIFRINEVVIYPEQLDKGLLLLKKLQTKTPLKKNMFAINIINYFKLRYNLSLGNFTKADELKSSSGFITPFSLIGPFAYKNEKHFNNFNLQSTKIINTNRYLSKNHSLRLSKVNSNKNGILSINNRYDISEKSVFFAQTILNAPKTDIYKIYISKTGFFDLSVNNTLIFKNRSEHGFFPAQYEITVKLNKGINKFDIKCINNEENIHKFAIQVFNSKNKSVSKFFNNKNVNSQLNLIKPVKLSESSFMRSDSNKLSNVTDFFDKAYLQMLLGQKYFLNKSLNNFTKISENSFLFPESLYYSGIAEYSAEQKDYYWNKLIKRDAYHIEALEKLALLKLKFGLKKQAFDIISIAEKNAPFSIITHRLKSYQFLKLNWFTRAKNQSNIIKKNFYKSAALQTEIELYSKLKLHKKLYNTLKKYFILDKYNANYATKLIEVSKFIFPNNQRVNLINNFIEVFPDQINFRLEASSCLFNMNKYKTALTLLSTAEKQAPNNKGVLFKFFEIYQQINKPELAKIYLIKALKTDEQNPFLRKYYDLLYGKASTLDNYLLKYDINSLSKKADKYRKEPALILSNDIIIKVFNDGSFLKRKRIAYKIFDSNNVSSLKQQQIVIDRDFEKIISLECFKILNGNKTKCGQYYTKDLSDPESRLYFNYVAKIISIPRLQNNSLLVLDYVIHSKRGKAMKGYFGEKIFLNDKFRSLKSNITVIAPQKKPLKTKTNNLQKIKIVKKSIKDNYIYSLQVNNLTSRKRENNMPPAFNRIPSVVFTSFSDWNKFYNWYKSLIKSQLILTDEMKVKIKEITKTCKTNKEKVKKIYYYITNRTRYVGFEMGIGGLQPRRTDVTYHSRLGDCKDIAVLLMVFFKEIGLESKLVLLRTALSGVPDRSTPYAGNFNHAICYVNIDGGLYLDGTVKNANIYELPSSDRDITVLEIDNNSYNFAYINSDSYLENIDQADTTVQVFQNGNALLKRTIIKTGNSAISARSSLEKAEKSNSLNKYWNSKYPGSKIDNYKVIEQQREKPVTYSYDINIPNYINVNNEMFIPTVLYPSNFIKSFAAIKSRKNNYIVDYSYKTIINIKYVIPAQYSIKKIPKNLNFSFQKNNISFKYIKINQNEIDVKIVYNFAKGIISKNSYIKFRKYLQTIAEKESQHIIAVKNKG